jgi:hypothetical protein
MEKNKKQYAQFFYKPDLSSEYKDESKTLKQRRHQMLIPIFMNPSAPGNNRLLLNYSMGSGKTKTVLSVAQDFVPIYEGMRLTMGVTPQVYVLGYSRDVFVTTLMTTPEFGYVSTEEMRQHDLLFERYNESRDRPDEPMHKAAYRDYYLRLRSRIGTTQIGGYYKFFGYIEFANKLGFKEDVVDINKPFLESLKYSLIIADEVHYTYNTDTLNAAGEALKYLLNYHGENIWFIGASGTPINNNPTEIVDLTAMLTGREFNKADIFTTDPATRTIAINHNALDRVMDTLKNKIAYYKDIDDTAYPQYEFVGEPYSFINPALAFGAPDFKFVKCIAGPKQRELLEQYTTDEIYISDYIIRDLAAPGISIKESSQGMLQIPAQLNLPATKDLEDWAAKYYKFTKILPTLKGKTLVFHNRVNGSGIKYIEKIMNDMGYIPDSREPANNTPCEICSIQYIDHGKIRDHKYIPARYNMIYSELDDVEIRANIRKFNSPANCSGSQVAIQLGAEKVMQSIDYSCLQNIICFSFPDNFPNLLQLIFRAVRRDAFLAMPKPWKPIQIFILVTSIDGGVSKLSIEEKIYARKFNWYVSVCVIEQALERISINRNMDTPVEGPIEDEEFFAYKYYKYEESTMRYLIRQAFKTCAQYIYADLWAFVCQHPTIRIDLNSTLFSKDLFNVVLTKMIVDEKAVLQFGPYYTTRENIFQQDMETKTVLVDMIDIISNSLRAEIEKSPSLELFKKYDARIHFEVIRDFIRYKNDLLKFYTKYHLATQTSYIDYSLNIRYTYKPDIEEFLPSSIEPNYNNIVGYYEDGSFKLIYQTSKNEDKRRNKRGMACKSIPKLELNKIAKRLDIKVDINSVVSQCVEIERKLLKLQAQGDKVYFSYLGRPSI